METTNPPPPNPPSVEAAYKRKCIALKKRLNEIEAENEAMRTRNVRGHRYIQKMRLESAMLLQRLSVVTGMAEDQVPGRNRSQSGARPLANEINTSEVGGNGAAGNGGGNKADDPDAFMDDDTEGSSEDHPPTPQERPLRVKRSRRSDENENAPGDDDNLAANEPNSHEPVSSTAQGGASPLPRTLPANNTRRTSLPQQEHLTSSFRVNNVSGQSTPVPTSPRDANSEIHQRQQSAGSFDHAAPSNTTPMDVDERNDHLGPDTAKRG